MKLRLSVLLLLAIILLSSCELKKTSKSTPQISFPEGSIITEHQKELTIKYNSQKEEYYMDTLYVDTTIMFTPLIFDIYNNLSEIYACTSNPDSFQLIWKKDLISAYIISESSNYEQGYFKLKGTDNKIEFAFEFTPKHESKNLFLNLKAISNASDYSEHNLTIKTPVIIYKD